MRKIAVVTVLFFMGAAFGIILAHGPLNAQSADNGSDIISKLNEIAKGQQELMTAINSIKEDLQIIKVRITQMQ